MNRFLKISFLVIFFFAVQENWTQTVITSEKGIEGLSMFPNPIDSDVLYITSTSNSPKTIEIFDILGKRRLAVSIIGTSIDISRLSPGLYIVKIQENGLSETRKLVVK